MLRESDLSPHTLAPRDYQVGVIVPICCLEDGTSGKTVVEESSMAYCPIPQGMRWKTSRVIHVSHVRPGMRGWVCFVHSGRLVASESCLVVEEAA